MKTLADMKLLNGQVEEITITDFRTRPGEIVTQVQMGKTFNITKNGKHVATISAPEPTALELGAAARLVGKGDY